MNEVLYQYIINFNKYQLLVFSMKQYFGIPSHYQRSCILVAPAMSGILLNIPQSVFVKVSLRSASRTRYYKSSPNIIYKPVFVFECKYLTIEKNVFSIFLNNGIIKGMIKVWRLTSLFCKMSKVFLLLLFMSNTLFITLNSTQRINLNINF